MPHAREAQRLPHGRRRRWRSISVVQEHDAAVVHEIARALEHYIQRFPDAADSIEGVHRWWLSPSLSEEAQSLVEAALTQLVEQGVLRQAILEDGRVIYSSGRKHQ